MELTDRLSTLPQNAQLKIMERIFQKLSLAFGNQMLAKWNGIDMEAVYEDWSQAMQDLTLAQIQHGIEASKEFQHPPSQGEFIAVAKQYKAPDVLKLSHKLSAEQIEKNRARIHGLADSLRRNKSVVQ